jgi:hypothetical protein
MTRLCQNDMSPDYINLLSGAVELKHACEAKHIESVPVTASADGKTVWKGMVEVFELAGHARAKRCFAWVEMRNGKRQPVTVLQNRLIISPEMAVKGWLASKQVVIESLFAQDLNSEIPPGPEFNA